MAARPVCEQLLIVVPGKCLVPTSAIAARFDRFTQHTVYLIPLVAESAIEHFDDAGGFASGAALFLVLLAFTVLDSDFVDGAGFLSGIFPWSVPRDRVINFSIDSAAELRKLDSIGQWWWRTIGEEAHRNGEYTTWHAWLRCVHIHINC